MKPALCAAALVAAASSAARASALGSSMLSRPPTIALPPPHRPRGLVSMPRADVSDPKAMLEQLKRSFDEFKAANDDKLNGKADDGKVERINADLGKLQAAIDELNLRAEAAKLVSGAAQPKTPEEIAYAKAFNTYARRGEIQAALSVGSAPDGGYTAPVEWDRIIANKLKLISAIRQYATVETVGTSGFIRLFNDRNVGSGWVGETAVRPNTSTPQLAPLTFANGEVYANPMVTQQLLDDSVINIDEWLSGEVSTEFDRQEGIAFITGDGVNKPRGFLTYVTGGTAAAVHPWGAIAVMPSGVAHTLNADAVLDMVYDLPSAYTANARLFANRKTFGRIRKFKDNNGNYLWQPSLAAGQPSTFSAQPLVELPDMPDVADNAFALAYGDMAETYLILDRIGVRVLRDPYTNKPYVSFYTTKRVGGGVKNPQAMRVMQIAAA